MSLNGTCTLFNKKWHPIKKISVRRALSLVFSEYPNGQPKAYLICPDSYQVITFEEWAKLEVKDTDQFIQTVSGKIKTPELVILTKYDRVFNGKVKFSRRAIAKRDDFTCQYCGIKISDSIGSLDHVIPRSRFGKSTWTNTVLACLPCNSKKADRTPEEAGMKLLKIPTEPTHNHIKFDFEKR